MRSFVVGGLFVGLIAAAVGASGRTSGIPDISVSPENESDYGIHVIVRDVIVVNDPSTKKMIAFIVGCPTTMAGVPFRGIGVTLSRDSRTIYAGGVPVTRSDSTVTSEPISVSEDQVPFTRLGVSYHGDKPSPAYIVNLKAYLDTYRKQEVGAPGKDIK